MEKNLVSLIRLEDAFSDIDVYDDTEEGEISYRQYLMRRWLFIHQDKYKNETLKDEDKNAGNWRKGDGLLSDGSSLCSRGNQPAYLSELPSDEA